MTDDEQIAAFLTNRGVTHCPTRFAAVTKSACVDEQVSFAPRKKRGRPPNWWRSAKKLRERWAYASF